MSEEGPAKPKHELRAETREAGHTGFKRGQAVQLSEAFLEDPANKDSIKWLRERQKVFGGTQYLVEVTLSPEEEDGEPIVLLTTGSSDEDFDKPFDFEGYYDTYFEEGSEEEEAYAATFGQLKHVPEKYLRHVKKI